MNIDVCEYKKSDFSQVKGLLLECFAVSNDPIKDSLIDHFNDSSMIFDFSNGFCGIVARNNSCVVGFLLLTMVLDPILNNNYCLIDYVCVTKKYQGKGIGTMLLNKAEVIAREKGCIYMQLSASRFRFSAHALYKKCGFVIRESDMFRKVL